MTHDKFCMDHGLIGLATADCTCKEIEAVRADERKQAGWRIADEVPHVRPCTYDGDDCCCEVGQAIAAVLHPVSHNAKQPDSGNTRGGEQV